MTATALEIRKWVYEGVEDGAAYVIIAVDTWDYENYPIYVMPDQDFYKRYDNLGSMQGVDEVYDLSLDVEAQLKERRAKHLPPRK